MEAAPEGAPEATPAKSELPHFESPPLSPGAAAPDSPTPASEPPAAKIRAAAANDVVNLEPAPALDAAPIQIASRRSVLRPRHKRNAMLAASVGFAAALGAVAGALITAGFSKPAQPDLALIEENKAMQQSIARLGKEIGTLKVSLEQTNKSANLELTRISERLSRAAAEVTGSLSKPQTVAVQPAPAPAPPPTPLPTPRPLPRVVAVEPPSNVLVDWTIWRVRNGSVFVAGHGRVFEAFIGASLPGLGAVQSVKRQDGRWSVQTPKGIIVSMRDAQRRYYDDD